MARHVYFAQWDNTNERLKEICDKVYSYNKLHEIRRYVNDSSKLQVIIKNESNLITETLYESGDYIEFVLAGK